MFKDMLKDDSKIFLATDEFAEKVNLDGLLLDAQLNTFTQEISSNEKKLHLGLHGDFIELHFKTDDYISVRKRLPFQGELCTLNGKKFYVKSSVDDLGIAKLTLDSYRMGQKRIGS